MWWIMSEDHNLTGELPAERIERFILLIRGMKILIDADLAALYGVSTKRLNEQVKRNQRRFPGDFMFRLTATEKAEVVANCDHLVKLKFSRVLPFAFTEHGSLMAATVLNSPRAIDMSLYVIRAFLKLRQMTGMHAALALRLVEMESKLVQHDQEIASVVRAIRHLSAPDPLPVQRRIGFRRGID